MEITMKTSKEYLNSHNNAERNPGHPHESLSIADEISKEFVLGAIVAAALFGLAIKICVRLLA